MFLKCAQRYTSSCSFKKEIYVQSNSSDGQVKALVHQQLESALSFLILEYFTNFESMKTKPLLLIILGLALTGGGEFLKISASAYADGGDSIQGLGAGILIGGAISAIAAVIEKRKSEKNAQQNSI